MNIIDVLQGSPEWMAVRCGIPTASNFDMLVDTDGKPSNQRKKYLYKLAGERITGVIEETYQNAAMIRGKEMEAEARSLYELTNGVTVEQVGFCLADGGFGASPDGLVGKDGIIEVKCPMIHIHVGYLLNGGMPSDYVQQVQGQLLVTGRKWADFISYFPGLKPLIVRVLPDAKFLRALSVELELFVKELDEICKKIGG